MNRPSPNPDPCPSVEDVLITHELNRRAARKPDFEQENRALLQLAHEIGTHPEGVLHKTAEFAMQLCRADSAGISVLEHNEAGDVFRGRVIVGQFSAHAGKSIPRNKSPCGVAT